MGLFAHAPIMDYLTLSPSVLKWAAGEVGMTLREVADKLSKKKQDDIVKGQLTESQITKLAKLTGVPLGYLFLEEPPPARALSIADFRTVQTAEPLSRDFFETLEDIEFKQDWYRAYLEHQGAEALQFIGGCAGHRDAKVIAGNIRAWLTLNDLNRKSLASPDELYSELVTRVERIGILVFKNGIVGTNTRRPLSVKEFRGFALSDNLAPLIFINGADAPAAWVFTLAHELAHLWLGQSGVSDANPRTDNATEKLCNQVAAEVLVPEQEFLAFWRRCQNERLDKWASIDQGRLEFRVSELVIARRALDFGLVDFPVYEHFATKRRGSSSGGDFYRTLNVRNSKTFSAKVASLAAVGTISFREAGQLLQVAPNRVMTVYKRQREIPT